MASGLSKYAERLAARRRDSEGRTFQPLTEHGGPTPIPRPLLYGYHPKHEVVLNTSREDAYKLFPHEFRNKKQIEFFRQPHSE